MSFALPFASRGVVRADPKWFRHEHVPDDAGLRSRRRVVVPSPYFFEQGRSHMLRALWPLMISAVVLSGCGGTGTPPELPSTEKAMQVSGKDQLKQRLESVAQSGAGGSGLAGIGEAIQALKATDASLAEQLQKDFSALEQAQSADQIKAIAGRMAGKIK